MTLLFSASRPCDLCKIKVTVSNPTELPKNLMCQNCKRKFFVCCGCIDSGCPSCGGTLVSIYSTFPYTALKAISDHNIRKVEEILSKNEASYFDLIDDEGDTPLIAAAKQQNFETCEWILNNLPADVNEKNRAGRTALIECIKFRSSDKSSVKLYTLLKSSINEKDKQGNTALMQAVSGAGLFGSKKGNLSIVKKLVEFGADLELVNNQGYTALGEAMKSNDGSRSGSANKEIIKYLKTQMKANKALLLFESNYQFIYTRNGVLEAIEKS